MAYDDRSLIPGGDAMSRYTYEEYVLLSERFDVTNWVAMGGMGVNEYEEYWKAYTDNSPYCLSLYGPFDRIPLYLNDANERIRGVAIWRLFLGR